tara:strand:+ start:3559 stop:3798 length:240 start_codon:yes stop_codon:yes gene_type:complete
MSKMCECHLIQWSGEKGVSIYIPSGEIYTTQKHGIIDCLSKVEKGVMNIHEFINNCRYSQGKCIPIKDDSIEEGIPPEQ